MSGDTPIQPFDFHRIFIGDLPWSFTLEIVFRTVVIYLFTLLLIRWLSQRAVGQLSLVEFLLVVALGSAVGDPMFYPDVPLLHAMIVITVVVLLNRGLDRLIATNERAERLIEGIPVRLIHHGLIEHENLERLTINRDELFQHLRLQGVEQLGEVREAYMEQNGRVSLFCFAQAEQHPGLAIVPPWELHNPRWFAKEDEIKAAGYHSCVRCGYTEKFDEGTYLPSCPHCQYNTWTDHVRGLHSTVGSQS
jgi:uncharacterized membrane protein YcaP (DUF421 family)